MQKEEFQIQVSQQLENCGPVRGCSEMSHVYDDNHIDDRQVEFLLTLSITFITL